MPDTGPRTPPAPATWADAFAALPLEAPPRGGWETLAARLGARRHARAPLWLAAATVALLAIALPWLVLRPVEEAPASGPEVAHAAEDPMEALLAESARLETLLAAARDDRFGSGAELALSGEIESRLATIDAALRQPGLSREQRHALWQERVAGLHTLAGIESSRRWLETQGAMYDTALVLVD